MEPPLKKHRAVANAGYGLLDCPRDVLRIIVNLIVDIESILRLSSVCKKMSNQNCLSFLHDCSYISDLPLSMQRSQRLAQLTWLQSLTLRIPCEYNTMEVLVQLTSLSRLQHLHLSIYGLEIDSSVEELFASLSNLTRLELKGSHPIPKSCRMFRSLTNLQRLVLFDSINHLAVLTSLRNLDHLVLQFNMMKSKEFEYLNYLPKLTYLDCTNNERMLEESFKCMSTMTALQVFKMSQISDDWGAYYTIDTFKYISISMTNLTRLVWNWSFNGRLPEEFTRLQQLRVFKRPEERMSTGDMDKLLHLTKLTKLQVAVAKDTAFKILSFTHLRSLSLCGEPDYNKEFVLSMLPTLTYLDL